MYKEAYNKNDKAEKSVKDGVIEEPVDDTELGDFVGELLHKLDEVNAEGPLKEDPFTERQRFFVALVGQYLMSLHSSSKLKKFIHSKKYKEQCADIIHKLNCEFLNIFTPYENSLEYLSMCFWRIDTGKKLDDSIPFAYDKFGGLDGSISKKFRQLCIIECELFYYANDYADSHNGKFPSEKQVRKHFIKNYKLETLIKYMFSALASVVDVFNECEKFGEKEQIEDIKE